MKDNFNWDDHLDNDDDENHDDISLWLVLRILIARVRGRWRHREPTFPTETPIFWLIPHSLDSLSLPENGTLMSGFVATWRPASSIRTQIEYGSASRESGQKLRRCVNFDFSHFHTLIRNEYIKAFQVMISGSERKSQRANT